MNWEELREIYQGRGGRIAGSLLGLTFAFLWMKYGLVWALVLGMFTLAGYLLGRQLDDHQESLGEFIDRVFPPGPG